MITVEGVLLGLAGGFLATIFGVRYLAPELGRRVADSIGPKPWERDDDEPGPEGGGP